MKHLLPLFSMIVVLAACLIQGQAAQAATDEPPVLDIPNMVVFSDVSDPIYTEDITAQISAEDDVDGDLTDQIYIIMNQYTGNEETIGEYGITYAVKDSINQIARLFVKVRVVDIDPPVIEGLQDHVIDINSDPIDFLDGIRASDNYDGDVTIFIEVDDSELNYASYGKYDVHYTVSDTSGNTSSYTVKVTIKDLVYPEIQGCWKIIKASDDLLTAQDILMTLTASDNIDGNISNQILIHEDTYTGNGDKVGTYFITYRIVDSAGNVTDHEVEIQVRNDIPNLLFIDDRMLELGKDEVVTNEDIEWLLTSVGVLDPYNRYHLQIIKDEYTGNENVAGTYDYFVKFISNTGEEIQKNLIIRVMYTIPMEEFPAAERPNWFISNMAWLIPTIIVGVSGGVLTFKYVFRG
jgi:hypothetical protein